ncbi:MAG: L-threonylcarbamoyladenylate synthase [Lamprobacter sp.]|uniref:L-threonylcarbamoyladenylate synthase n=1 Tax=Lamprobacter sp. TaxID=3100796 RepID=UPI002B25C5DB|nr:L-threonylcarbamoyladenylate synthase [Lamprobacter sp.]MEA3643140.1 L-threonylcarbamoyladenylate synthase [Lamprobacter sp.]
MELLQPDPSGIQRAVELLRRGELVAFPTETVYGLGANANDDQAIGRIFAAKGRPANHPLIVHLPAADTMRAWARAIPDAAWRLADVYWPGPLTLVLNKAADVSNRITGGQDTVGLRVPAHPVAQQLLQTFGAALAAPSANRFGRISPTTAAHVLDEFAVENRVLAVLDGGACSVGLESTIIDLSDKQPRLLRPGMIDLTEIEQLLGEKVARPAIGDGPAAPGRLPSHYAPTTPLAVMSGDAIAAMLTQARPGIVVLARQAPVADIGAHHWVIMPNDPEAYAFRLYAELRRLDQMHLNQILVEQPLQSLEWEAINNRLERAATPVQH